MTTERDDKITPLMPAESRVRELDIEEFKRLWKEANERGREVEILEVCEHCGQPIRDNELDGWIHVNGRTQCELYATPKKESK